jgi:hypothetical protein
LDGEWAFERAEEPGTPWYTYHQPSIKDGSCRRAVSVQTTLRACRLAVGRGWAAKDLERVKVEEAVERTRAAGTAT